MSKKIIGLIISATLIFSLAGCGNENKKAQENNNNKNTAEISIDESKYDGLKGDWIRDFTFDEFKQKNDEIIKNVEEQSKEFGLDYKNDKTVKQIDGQTANVTSIYLDNKNPEENKLESMQYQMQLLGDSQQVGKIEMKVSLKFDGAKAIEENKFNLGDTAIAKYSEILTGKKDRNYDEINKKIMDIIKSGDKQEGVFEDNINGLIEEYAVSKDYIVYTISTKQYKFKESHSNGI